MLTNIKCLTLFVLIALTVGSINAQDIDSTIDSIYLSNNHSVSTISTSNSGSNFVIDLYKKYISPIYLSNCAFQPSCSQYSKGLFAKRSFLMAILLSADRLTRCHPHAWKYEYQYDHKTHLCIDHP